MIRDETFRRKLPFRGRGVAELERRIGGVHAEIDARLARGNVVQVLELGCGYGTALLELCARYGGRAALHGVNRVPHDGNLDILRRNARVLGVFGDTPPDDDAWPRIAYADVAAGLPFPDDSFDVVYSQVAWPYFGDKIGVLRETMRVLRADGVAKIEADVRRFDLPPEHRQLVEIREGERVVAFDAYLQDSGVALARASDSDYLRFGKVAGFGDDLTLAREIDLAGIDPHWDGIRCIYSRSG